MPPRSAKPVAKAGAKKAAPDFGGMDPALMMDLMKKIPPNSVTGKTDLMDVVRYMEEHPDEMSKYMEEYDRSGLGESKINLETYDYKALAPKIVHESFWVLQLESMGFVDRNGNEVDPVKAHSTPGIRPIFMIYCYDDQGGFRLTQQCTGLPDSDTVLLALKRAIAEPILPLKPCLPWDLMIAIKLAQHADTLRPFLDSIPAPFRWRIETREQAQNVHDGVDDLNQKGIKNALELAERSKAEGNKAFARKDRQAALKAYEKALRFTNDVFAQKPVPEDEEKAKKLQAICYGNRAATYLLPGGGMDPKKALQDGQAAEKAAPNYGKAYIRQASASQLLGNIDEAQDTIARALRRKDLENDVGLVDRLIELLTGGKGFSNDEAEFKQWMLDIMINDQKTGERINGLQGEWKRRCDTHFSNFKR